MKKLISLLIVAFILLSCFSVSGENSGYENMTDEELQEILDTVQAELQRRKSLAAATASSPLQLGDQQYTVSELVDMCAAISHELSGRISLESFNVPVGTWTVGKHLKAGLYSIIPQNGSDSVYCSVTMSQFGVNSINVRGETESGHIHHLLLAEGDTIEIQYHGVTFGAGSPYPIYAGSDYSKALLSFENYSDSELKATYTEITHMLSNQSIPAITLEGGIWIVGQDIPAGTYDIEAYVNEKYGNYGFLIYGNATMFGQNRSDLAMYGFGRDHETSASNIALVDGNIVYTRGCMAKLTVSDTDVFFGPK